MLGTVLVVLGLAATPMAPAPPAATPEELIARLGAPRYAEREAAAVELEKLGRRALPALIARREHRDLEIRSRVNALVVKIEGSLLLEPTLVAVDIRDRPLGEVVAAIASGSDLPVALAPNAPIARRVTLATDGPVPFWTAIDRVADLADLGYTFPNPPVANFREHPLTLAPTTPRPGGPMSDHGPFRVNLMSLHYQRDLSFVGAAGFGPNRFNGRPVAADPGASAGGRATNEQFYLRLQAAAEPRLAIRRAGALKLAAAVDDLGQSLLAPSTADPDPNGGMMTLHSYSAGMSSAPLQFQVPLRRPESPGRTIRLLRGAIPASIATRRPNPIEVPLAGAGGKTYRNDDVTLVVNDGKPFAPGVGQVSLDLTITAQPSRLHSPAAEPAPEVDPFLQRAEIGPLQLELADASGRVLSWYVANSQQNGDETRLSVTVNPGPSGGPTTLRYYGTIRATAEIPFEFRDVPMP